MREGRVGEEREEEEEGVCEVVGALEREEEGDGELFPGRLPILLFPLPIVQIRSSASLFKQIPPPLQRACQHRSRACDSRSRGTHRSYNSLNPIAIESGEESVCRDRSSRVVGPLHRIVVIEIVEFVGRVMYTLSDKLNVDLDFRRGETSRESLLGLLNLCLEASRGTVESEIDEELVGGEVDIRLVVSLPEREGGEIGIREFGGKLLLLRIPF